MIEDFSSGYYRMMMNVQEYDDGPAIQDELYEFINKEIYLDSTSPVMMRVGLDAGQTFPVSAERSIPRDVLALPEELVDETGQSSIFVLKSEYLDTVGEYNGRC
jgi:hypothetical protein